MKRFSFKKFTALLMGFVVAGATMGLAGAVAAQSGAVQPSVTEKTDPNANAGSRQGYILLDAVTGDVLSHKNADELFIPASLAKIPTALIALHTLGTTRRLQTRLMTNGVVTDGVLHGDLHLVGSGDPSLKKSDITAMASKLASAGVQGISGQFTYDPSALPQSAVIDQDQPFGATYNPPVSGLNIDRNLRVVNGQRRAIKNPGRRAAYMLRYLAHNNGITLPEPIRSDGHSARTEIAVHKSALTSHLIAGMMESSSNLAAEALGVLSVARTGRSPRSLAEAAQATGEWVKAEAGPIDGKGWSGFRMMNHSGLSTRTRATPRQMAAILRLGYQRFGKTFTDMHSENRPGGFQAYSLRGKFGALKFVRGYGGFLTINGRELIFAIMSDNRRNRARVDAGETGLNSNAWMEDAHRQEQSVLGEWLVDLYNTKEPEPSYVTPEPSLASSIAGETNQQ